MLQQNFYYTSQQCILVAALSVFHYTSAAIHSLLPQQKMMLFFFYNIMFFYYYIEIGILLQYRIYISICIILYGSTIVQDNTIILLLQKFYIFITTQTHLVLSDYRNLQICCSRELYSSFFI